ncbi:pyridoxamine 5'-phosphate oxidase [Drechmeria coniospora]|uniref:pyridoxal 5'-phosphate synthase n=1 Tax=Drechmeria coniospora TaxID=98403 RepID=A0A151GYG4_DRECN|nr:pyridoxamine 5'-phosphate oxidase [Drechmeria coniospora]KYK62148.1 pyridoxamine 5'-phosphate oxidase [Drechmeria coniospora]
MALNNVEKNLSLSGLDAASPAAQFRKWYAEAKANESISMPETCTLSTSELPSGRVSSRIVYMKELDTNDGFVLISNFGTSRKGSDLASNPHAALVFHWPALQRQVRVEGVTERLSKEQNQADFDVRARDGQMTAWASRQSQPLQPSAKDGDDGLAQLRGWLAETEKRFDGQDKVPVPEFWGGLRIVPTRVEFWEGRKDRLHDRFVYEKDGGKGWKINRLSP